MLSFGVSFTDLENTLVIGISHTHFLSYISDYLNKMLSPRNFSVRLSFFIASVRA